MRKENEFDDYEDGSISVTTKIIVMAILVVLAAIITWVLWGLTHPKAESSKEESTYSSTYEFASEEVGETEPAEGSVAEENIGAATESSIVEESDVAESAQEESSEASRESTPAESSVASSESASTQSGTSSQSTTSSRNRVSTQDGRVIVFTDCDDYISPKQYVNMRLEPSTSEGNATVHARLEYGVSVHRTGVSEDSGWSRIEYEGITLYVVTSYMYVVE